MALDLSTLATDPQKENEGVWFDYFGGSRLLIARNDNEKAEKLRFELAKPHAYELQKGGDEAIQLMQEIDSQVTAQAILLGWEGLTFGETALEYDADTALTLLTDPRFKDLRKDVENYSKQRSRYSGDASDLIKRAVKKAADS